MKSTMTNAISLTQSEVEALAYKATKGAGLPWGIAEEAAFIARWFHARGVDILSALVDHLDDIKDRDWDELIDPNKGISALCFGPSLGDFLSTQDRYYLGQTMQPLFLLPFVDAAALANSCSYDILADGTELTPCSSKYHCSNVTVRMNSTSRFEATYTPCTTYPIDVKDRLDALAFATYVPATEASRAGAGSEQSDND